MNRLWLTVPLLSLIAACAGARPKETAERTERPHRSVVAQQVLPASVRVFVYDEGSPKRSGSGVVIAAEATASGRDLFILTNAHLLEPKGLKSPAVRVVAEVEGESLEYPAELAEVGNSPAQDFALLRVRGLNLPKVDLAQDDELQVGEDVLVVGAPFGQALTISGGMISSLQRDPKLREPILLKTDAAVGYGSSGAGVFSASTGHLLALVEGYRTTRVGFAVENQDYTFELPMPGETFAAPVAKIRRFLNERGLSRFLVSATR